MGKILLVDKPIGWTSNDVVQKIKNTFHYNKVGHAGTLDPNASGLLIIGYNEDTKKLGQLMLDNKQYIAQIQFGILTDSGDVTGKTIKTLDSNVSLKQIEAVCEQLKINYLQKPHAFSAVKVDGYKSYELARKKIIVDLPSKLVHLLDFKIISFDTKQQLLEIILDVSKGFYVRSFAIDLAAKLDNVATLKNLIRTKCGEYELINAYNLKDLINQKNNEQNC